MILFVFTINSTSSSGLELGKWYLIVLLIFFFKGFNKSLTLISYCVKYVSIKIFVGIPLFNRIIGFIVFSIFSILVLTIPLPWG